MKIKDCWQKLWDYT